VTFNDIFALEFMIFYSFTYWYSVIGVLPVYNNYTLIQ